MNSTDLPTELNRFRERLLDLTSRNPLISYRKSSRRTLQIVDELPDQMFGRLVNENSRFRFDPAKEIHSVVSEEEPRFEKLPLLLPTRGEETAIRHQDDRLQTNLPPDRLDSVLRSIQRDAASAIEETGVNYLYLAIGLLSWKESGGSREILSPLILVPIHIERFFDAKIGHYSYAINWSEEEIKSNLSLAKRMERDFGLQLPELQAEQLPEEYFNSILELISVKEEWDIRREAFLGFFSFHKLHMYLDIDPANWVGTGVLSEATIVNAIISGQESDVSDTLYAQDYEIDNEPVAQKIFLATEADSSQHSALVDIANGKNLVIEGPPGTGKSQTITNAIAAAICEGKRVLFVAEKLAALEVVKHKLSTLGLGQFCLELHSDAAKPRLVFESIKERMEGHFHSPSELNTTVELLESKKAIIQEYLKATSEKCGPFNEPLYDGFWRIISLRNKGTKSLRAVDCNFPQGRAAFEERRHALAVFGDTLSEVEEPTLNPWWGFFPSDINPNHYEPLLERLDDLSIPAKELNELVERLRVDLHLESVDWMLGIQPDDSACQTLESLANSSLKSELINQLSDSEVRDENKAFLQSVENARHFKSQCEPKLLVDLDAATATSSQLEQTLNSLAAILPNGTVGEVRSYGVWLRNVIELMRKLEGVVDRLEKQGLGRPATLEEYERSEYLFKLFRHPIVVSLKTLHADLFLNSANANYEQARKEAARLLEERRDLGRYFHMPSVPPEVEVQEIADKIRPHIQSWFAFLSSDYRLAKAKLGKFWRPLIGKSPSSWIMAIEKLQKHLSEMKSFSENRIYTELFSENFSGVDSNWEQVKTLLDWVNTAKKRGLGHEKVSKLLKFRDAAESSVSGSAISQLRKQITQELSQEKMLATLGIASADLQTIPFDVVLKRASTSFESVQAFEEAARCFSKTEATRLAELRDLTSLIQSYQKVLSDLSDETSWRNVAEGFARSVNSEIESLVTSVQWIERLIDIRLPIAVSMAICSSETPAQLCKHVSTLLTKFAKSRLDWESEKAQLCKFGMFTDEWLNLTKTLATDPGCLNTISKMKACSGGLPNWIAFSKTKTQCDDLGLGPFVSATILGELPVESICDCFELTVLEKIAESKVRGSLSLQSFSRQKLDSARAHFKRYDEEITLLNRQMIAYRASKISPEAGIARGRVAELTEMGLVRHEVQKQTRHCKIRDLLKRAGKSVQALKPCFMMSPLSIAQYLPPDSNAFDLVIMDEASQIKPEDALGTILRAKQLVVVGDPKQMPPTSFFDRTSDDVDDEDATQFDNTESILEVALKSFQPIRRLRWHYRSKHESLIHFSNSKFYDNDLVVFPTASTEQGKLGVRHHFVEDAVFSGGGNAKEAEVIADAIIRHALECPNETLGVGTFNQKQSSLILEVLEAKCEKDAAAREAVDEMFENEEHLFVKNLENLQGDERDVIFISYTYGPDASGRVFNRFGPMTMEVGWRRLNVLVTRARHRVEVFSSLLPTDIKAGPGKSRGVNAMRDYLEYSRTGFIPSRIFDGERGADSPFEESVARVIENMGLEVVPQVGVAGYFVDIGVLTPGCKDDFLLGIECDGAAYHSSKSARDRDRLRENIIRSRGWDIHRIWSTDWFFNQQHEETRLRSVLEEALRSKKIGTEK